VAAGFSRRIGALPAIRDSRCATCVVLPGLINRPLIAFRFFGRPIEGLPSALFRFPRCWSGSFFRFDSRHRGEAYDQFGV